MKTTDDGVGGAAAAMGLRAKAGPWGQALVAAADQRDDIVAVSADLKKYTDLTAFAKTYPERYIEVGMAEQNLVMTAAGLARAGLTVVATTFAAFLSRRAADFAVMQIALPRADVKLIGATPGISATFGPSHTAIDDLAVWRAVPNMIVIDPADPDEAAQALTAVLDYDGPVYLRQPFNRASARRTQEMPPFELGRAALLRDGTDVGIIAGGDRVGEALAAAETLAESGVAAAVLRVSTLKPFDGDAVAELASRTGRLITAENHSVIGGLFSATAEALALRGVAVPVTPIGVPDVFPPFGSPDYTADLLGMGARHIVQAALGATGCRPETGAAHG
ncbi:transketolase C-terminal domain-containing protein [[Mycobacterium] kokjensenii]|uniref:Transketolase C-terminal domain-containing protein n=1 Tax=[Mycobacterium] kokjensenii TaxID=3064287 RepID=A0ABN9MR29_9MYCO|nr:transketolase C-terminal domain-containing protein [Mycolicibacter sp. MU0083]CAJ1493097.1 transketolase C-terminal domain-containing protein [Mycolicibacter sp. MU0083]